MIDNTIIIGTACITALALIWKGLQCKHAWELVDKTEFPPAIEAYRHAGGTSLHWGYLSGNRVEVMSRKTVVLALRCPKCGRALIKKITS